MKPPYVVGLHPCLFCGSADCWKSDRAVIFAMPEIMADCRGILFIRHQSNIIPYILKIKRVNKKLHQTHKKFKNMWIINLFSKKLYLIYKIVEFRLYSPAGHSFSRIKTASMQITARSENFFPCSCQNSRPFPQKPARGLRGLSPLLF